MIEDKYVDFSFDSVNYLISFKNFHSCKANTVSSYCMPLQRPLIASVALLGPAHILPGVKVNGSDNADLVSRASKHSHYFSPHVLKTP